MTQHSLTRATRPQVDQVCPRHSELDSLLVRVGGGDRDAFAELYDEMSQTVYGVSLGSDHGPAFSARVTLDAFVRVWHQSGTYDPRSESAWTWVRAIALEELASHLEAHHV